MGNRMLLSFVGKDSIVFDGTEQLRKLTALEHLTLDLDVPSQSASYMVGVFKLSLPKLRTISLTQSPDPIFTFPLLQDVTRFLHLPTLDTLTLTTGRLPLPTFAGPLDNPQNLRLSTFALPHEITAFLARHGSVMAFYAEDGVDVLRLLPIVEGRAILLPNMTSPRLNATWMVMDPECVVEIIESRSDQLDELVIVGKDYQLRQVEGSLKRVEGLLERWNVACRTLKVVEVGENVFRRSSIRVRDL